MIDILAIQRDVVMCFRIWKMILQFAQNCSTDDIVIAEKGERKYSAKKWKPIQLNQNSYHQNIFAFEMSLRSQIGWNERLKAFLLSLMIRLSLVWTNALQKLINANRWQCYLIHRTQQISCIPQKLAYK